MCGVGVVVNVMLSVMLKVLLFVSVYCVSKVVVNVFIELMVVEFELFGVCVYLVLLGCVFDMCFVDNVWVNMYGFDYEVYVEFVG